MNGKRMISLFPGVPLTGVEYDSRAVRPGCLFVALPGAKTDGACFVEDAVRRGAAAVLHAPGVRIPKGVPHAETANPRAALADAAAEYYGHPSEKLAVLGVTGTNGKTTVTFMTRRILEAAGTPCALVGTVRYEIGGRSIPANRTTPEASDLQRMFAEALQAGCRAAALEVSSQGLCAGRLRGTRFAAAAFTNLTVDHLDFHKTLDAYFAAKRQLFDMLLEDAAAAPAVVNIDDPHGRELAADVRFAGRLLTTGFAADATVRAESLRLTGEGSVFRALTPWGTADVRLPFAGRFNVQNALTAMALCGALGVAPAACAAVLEEMEHVPGRLERIPDPRGGRLCFVDYAHTEDALQNVLETLRETARGRLICVFGCGGDRDTSKRPKMGAVVSRLADLAVVTSDNPRSEAPEAIVEQILAGMDRQRPIQVELDRKTAIQAALNVAGAGDMVLVAGKGHEPYQEVAGRRFPFDDRDVLRDFLA